MARYLATYVFGAVLCYFVSSATRSVEAAPWKIPCPSDKLSCVNGTNIGLVEFESSQYSHIEHAKEGNYKDLVCYPQNFCSLRWLKDGLPLPWGLWSEGMGVTQGTCNTTLEFRRIGMEAAGNYTCLVTGANGTTISRTITLKVEADVGPMKPIPVAGDLCANHTAALGDDATFSCDIYVGEKDLSYSFAYWEKQVGPDQWDIVGFNYGTKPGGYLTSTLHVTNVTSGSYTNYKLWASSGFMNSETLFTLRPPASQATRPLRSGADEPVNYGTSASNSAAAFNGGNTTWSWNAFGVGAASAVCALLVLLIIILTAAVRRQHQYQSVMEYKPPRDLVKPTSI